MPKDAFFLHIPKTAGTSLNEYLSSQYDAPTAQHIELHREWKSEDFWTKYPFISGHINVHEARKYARKSFIFITFVRNPWRQLLSTIRFQYAIAHPKTSHHFAYLGETAQLRASSNRMHEYDLEKPSEFREWLASFGRVERRLFDNFQTRFLSVVTDDATVTEEHVAAATRELRNIEGVGVVERMNESVTVIDRVAGFKSTRRNGPGKLNQQLIELKGLDTPEIKTLCEPLIQYDQRLYEFANRLLTDRLHYLGKH